ncbi:sigma-54 interaction domain-containing protein [Fusibacter ferrireducens]|uniref:Sigma 54-interacting transcriptional regulator n=1 Tax=Fusibacter ferrireducens TaxID=2785058 RepID=A0ABR9ZYF8_9FIRM|nr:sigma 54-interacting transcriptional regulator [Fusibacter ferrireducens]MBF4695498.1 sigma 54-interacting transcriptional regulator [Fusibacter ferrireducens]
MSTFLTEAQAKFLLNYISDGIQIVNSDGILIYCNRQAAMLDDINISESIGKHITEVYPSLIHEESTLLDVIESREMILNRDQTYRTYRGKLVTTINSTLPILDRGEIKGAVEISKNITEYKELSERYLDLQSQVREHDGGSRSSKASKHYYNFEDIITDNAEFNRVKTIAMKAARTDIPVLIYGETGTGKELLTQAIHNSSKRRSKHFIAQNCAALPSTLLEGILFGTTKGGFTGAVDRQGLFELADGGTLFLDEINSMPVELQAKLLRVLQDGKLRRIGDSKEIYVDVRIIAACNIDPNIALEKGLIRRDLYYRLNTVTLWIPKLSDRKEDIPLLTKYFISKYNNKLYRNIQGVSKEVEKLFLNYNWEGNVRELEHVIEGAINFVETTEIGLMDLPPNLRRFSSLNGVHLDHSNELEHSILSMFGSDNREIKDLKSILDDIEKVTIQHALRKCGGNVTKASKQLGVPRQTLQYKLKKYDLETIE